VAPGGEPPESVMVDAGSLGVAISFTAGLLSFLSPCVLPLIPSYVTFVTGLGLEDVQRARRTALVHSLLFTAGFTAVFVSLGATATAFGRLLGYHRIWVGRAGGVLVILLGLYLLGAINVRALATERRIHFADKPLGYLGTAFVGMAFAAGWTPCIGPILGGVLTYTASTANLPRGMVLLLAYSLGLALPFIAAALAVERFIAAFARVRGWLVWTSRVAGALLIAVGILLLTNYLTLLSSALQGLTPEALRSRL
jgi:cytochrome c-type biogenesis protein